LRKIEGPSPVQGPPNHIDLIGNLRVRGRKTLSVRFLRRGRRVFLSNQCDFVGLGRGSDAPFLLNQGISDLALRVFRVTYQNKFLGTKID